MDLESSTANLSETYKRNKNILIKWPCVSIFNHNNIRMMIGVPWHLYTNDAIMHLTHVIWNKYINGAIYNTTSWFICHNLPHLLCRHHFALSQPWLLFTCIILSRTWAKLARYIALRECFLSDIQNYLPGWQTEKTRFFCCLSV